MNRQMRRLVEKEERRQKQEKKGPQRRQPQQGDRPGIAARFVQFMREVRLELRRVSWPSREQMVAFTAVTIITSAALTLIIFGMDLALKEAVILLLEQA